VLSASFQLDGRFINCNTSQKICASKHWSFQSYWWNGNIDEDKIFLTLSTRKYRPKCMIACQRPHSIVQGSVVR